MKADYLFPEIFRKIGWLLLVPFLVAGAYCLFGDGAYTWPFTVFALISEPFGEKMKFCTWIYASGLMDELAIIGLTVSLLFISFSKERDEDECIEHIRMQSLVWSILVSYVLLIFAALFIFGLAFLTFAFINMFTVLVLFIIKYNWELYKFRRDDI